MKAVVQRVSSASVRVDGRECARVERGLLVLLGVEMGDTESDAEALAGKTARLRIFEDPPGRMNRSIGDIDGSALVVSQFTLLARCDKGNRPSFDRAEAPDRAQALYEAFAFHLAATGIPVQTGRFAAHMDVDLTNEGPVTIILDSAALRK